MTAGSMPRQPAGEAPSHDWDRGFDEPGLLEGLVVRFRPDEGWLSLILILTLAGTMAWSIADARWILGRDDLTSFVIWIAIAASLWGYLSARSGVSPWIAQVSGAAVGAFVLIEVVGASVPGAEGGLGGWFQATANSVAQAYLDLTWRHQIATTQLAHFSLVIGIVVWGTAQAASYDVFGYHRAINGVLLMAVVLLANMALTVQDQFLALVLFSAAALALLLRAHAADERTNWLRHRIWRGGDLKAPRAQGGIGFASAAICAALVLTTVASSAPLANAWPGSNDLRDFLNGISGYLPGGSQSRFTQGADFGSSTAIGSSFHSSSDLILTIQMPEGTPNSHWRVISYDSFKSTGWSAGEGSQSDLLQGADLNHGTLDQVDEKASSRTKVTYKVTVRDTSLKHLVLANEPGSVTVPVARVLVGGTPATSDVVWFPSDSTSYSVTSFVPNLNLTGTGLTEWKLRQAGTDYPPELLSRYTQGVDLIGPAGDDLLSQMLSFAFDNGVALDPTTGRFADAYDAAKVMQEFMRDPKNFTYDSNITDLVPKCASLTSVDCFAIYKRGFCEQYATTMTMLMRMEGFPARYVEGYLSGHVEEASRAIDVTGQQRHAWVEVYFPGYGWIPFDPTGGSVGQPTQLAAGKPALETPSPKPTATSTDESTGPDVTPRRPAPGTTLPSSTSDNGPLGLVIPALISLLFLLAVLATWRRRPRRLESPDTVYRGIVRTASRLGYKPLPTQTVYEFTGMLADVVPRARDPLEEVATAQVEVVYGRRRLPAERLMSLATAQRVVHQALLRLVFRIPGRGPKWPRKDNERRR
jgi:transglutaminase-like putative cysteine protease